MAWSFVRSWPAVSAGSSGFTTTLNTTTPAGAGSTLKAVVAVRPTTTPAATPAMTVTDDLGGTWVASPFAGDEATSTRLGVFVRTTYAEGVTSVTATAAGTSQIHLYVLEYTGGTAPFSMVSAATLNASATTWPALMVAAPENAVVVGAASLGVTNRVLALTSGDYTASGELKASGVHSLVATKTTTTAETTGPAWTATSGSASSMCAVTAAITGTTTSDPDPPTVPAEWVCGPDGIWYPATTELL